MKNQVLGYREQKDRHLTINDDVMSASDEVVASRLERSVTSPSLQEIKPAHLRTAFRCGIGRVLAQMWLKQTVRGPVVFPRFQHLFEL
jgi:hypothetical protein